MIGAKTGARPDRRWRGWVAAGVGLEAAALVGYGIFLAVETAITPTVDRAAAAFLALTFVAIGSGVALVARGLSAGWPGARSPATVWQLLQASLASPSVRLPGYLGVALVGVALAVLGGLFWPVGERSGPSGEPGPVTPAR